MGLFIHVIILCYKEVVDTRLLETAVLSFLVGFYNPAGAAIRTPLGDL
jgi:hypothetical protein